MFGGQLELVAETMKKYNFSSKYNRDPSRACEVLWHALYDEDVHGQLDTAKGQAWLNTTWKNNFGDIKGRLEELYEFERIDEAEQNMEVIVYNIHIFLDENNKKQN